ncbi:MAG: alanine racemase [bacterium]|nr:alanine racemase [bacterium]
MSNSCRATKLIIEKKCILKNIENIQKYLGNNVEIMPILKANAYGTYINKELDIIEKFNIVGVSLVDEAIEIRKCGYKGDILILYPPVESEIEDIIKYDLTINGCNFSFLKLLNNKLNRKIKIHLEIETGMGRTGVLISKLNEYLKEMKTLDKIELEGLFTHFSSSSKDEEFSKVQIFRFEKALKIINENNLYPKFIHICNSGAIFNYKEYLYNMVRIGIMIYGYYPNPKFKDIIKLYPSMTLKTSISFIKKIEPGDTVGYNKNFVAKRDTIVATIPFGFGDGFISLETGQAYVLINNKKAPIIGICMDNMMLDITDIPDVDYNTEVYIWDNKNITVEQITDWCKDLCNYEILSSLSDRIPRYIVGDKR